MSKIDHSKDVYIVGGVALILFIVAVVVFMLTGSSANSGNPAVTGTVSATSSVTGVDTGTTTAPSASESPAAPASPAVVTLAQCLGAKKVTMYGAYWCTHCQAQKKAFGDAFRYVPYVECTQNTKLCLDKGIEGYPTWILPNGQKLEGEQTLESLAKSSGCLYKP